MDDTVVLLAFVWISLLAAGFLHYVFSNFIRHHQAPDTTKRTQDADHEIRDSKSEEVDVSAKVPSTHVTQERTEIVNGDEKNLSVNVPVTKVQSVIWEDTVQRSDNERRILPSPPARRDNVDDESWQQLPEHEAPPPPYSAEQPKDENPYYTDGQNITKEQDTQQISTEVDPQSKKATLLPQDMPGLGVPTKKKKHESVQELQYAMTPMKLLEVKRGNQRVIESFEKEPLKFKLDQDGCCVVTPYCVALFPVDCVKEEKTITMRADPHGPYSKVSKERLYICPHIVFESEQKMEFEAYVTLTIVVQYSAKDPDVKIKLHVERINKGVITDDKLASYGQGKLVSIKVKKFCKFGIYVKKEEFPKMRRHYLNTVFLTEPSEEIPKFHIIHSYVCSNGFFEVQDLLKMIKTQRAKILVHPESFEVNYGDNGRAKFYGQDIQVEPVSTVVNFSSRWTSPLFSVDRQFSMSLINLDKLEGLRKINFKMDVDGSNEYIIEENYFFLDWKFRFQKTEINATGEGSVGQKFDVSMGDDKLTQRTYAEISADLKNLTATLGRNMMTTGISTQMRSVAQSLDYEVQGHQGGGHPPYSARSVPPRPRNNGVWGQQSDQPSNSAISVAPRPRDYGGQQHDDLPSNSAQYATMMPHGYGICAQRNDDHTAYSARSLPQMPHDYGNGGHQPAYSAQSWAPRPHDYEIRAQRGDDRHSYSAQSVTLIPHDYGVSGQQHDDNPAYFAQSGEQMPNDYIWNRQGSDQPSNSARSVAHDYSPDAKLLHEPPDPESVNQEAQKSCSLNTLLSGFEEFGEAQSLWPDVNPLHELLNSESMKKLPPSGSVATGRDLSILPNGKLLQESPAAKSVKMEVQQSDLVETLPSSSDELSEVLCISPDANPLHEPPNAESVNVEEQKLDSLNTFYSGSVEWDEDLSISPDENEPPAQKFAAQSVNMEVQNANQFSTLPSGSEELHRN
ncbi:uncharacterized protein LOC120337162 [Styela clava]